MNYTKPTLIPAIAFVISICLLLFTGCATEQSKFQIASGDKEMHTAQYNDALIAYKKANTFLPSDQNQLRVAGAQINLGQYQAAHTTLAGIKSPSASSYYLSALCYLSLADPTNAQTDIEKSLQYDPIDIHALSLYGEILMANHNYLRSAQIYNQTLALCTQCDIKSELLHNQTMAYLYSGQYNDAKETYQHYLQSQRHITSQDHKLAGAIAWGAGDHPLAMTHWQDLNQRDKAQIIAAIDQDNDIYKPLTQSNF